jgi:RNA polymerase subunit RPABC4/transcription elongation factor Spt4
MAKRCRECNSVTQDDIGVCGGCGFQSWKPQDAPSTAWQYVSVIALTCGVVAAFWSFVD